MTKQIKRLSLAVFLISSLFLTGSIAQTARDADYDRMVQMTGPFGGDVTAMAIDRRSADRIWIGASDGQIFRSTDGGKGWTRIRPGVKAPSSAVTVILLDSEKPGVIYVGMKPLLDLNEETNGGGVFVSEDDCRSWSLFEGMRGRSVRAMSQSAKDPNAMAVAARDGVYYTTDRGKTWKRITPENDPELKGFHSVAIDPRDANVIYVGTHHLPWRTTDAGKTWKRAASKERGMIDDSDIFAIHIDQSNPDTVLMSACSGIYRSRDASETWSKLQGIPYTSRRTHVIYQHPTRPQVIFAGTTEGLWVSTDGGKPDSWRRMTSPRTVINAVAVHPDRPDRVFLGVDDVGVLISVDGGGAWRQSTNGMGARDVYSLYQSDSNPGTIYAGTNNGLFRSDDRGRNWAQVKKAQVKAGAKSRKTSKLERDTLVDLQNQVFAILPFTPIVSAPNSGKGDSHPAPALSSTSSWMVASTWNGLFITEDEKKGWREIKFSKAINRTGGNTAAQIYGAAIVTNP